MQRPHGVLEYERLKLIYSEVLFAAKKHAGDIRIALILPVAIVSLAYLP